METKKTPIEIPVEEFDRRFDAEDITPHEVIKLKKLVIFGAGERGISFKNSFLKCDTLFSSEQFEVLFCDNDEKKWDTIVDGTRCYAPLSCLNNINPQSDVVVVANSDPAEIFHTQLRGLKRIFRGYIVLSVCGIRRYCDYGFHLWPYNGSNNMR
jgi:hypothetical protein